MVKILKKRKTYCKNKCKKHTLHKVSQYKKGADSVKTQGRHDT
jgi:large subunit ribosomal protein L44e